MCFSYRWLGSSPPPDSVRLHVRFRRGRMPLGDTNSWRPNSKRPLFFGAALATVGLVVLRNHFVCASGDLDRRDHGRYGRRGGRIHATPGVRDRVHIREWRGSAKRKSHKAWAPDHIRRRNVRRPRCTLKTPVGFSKPERPLDTFHISASPPGFLTVMRCGLRSTKISTLANAGVARPQRPRR
jgi:hypothetical protein